MGVPLAGDAVSCAAAGRITSSTAKMHAPTASAAVDNGLIFDPRRLELAVGLLRARLPALLSSMARSSQCERGGTPPAASVHRHRARVPACGARTCTRPLAFYCR